MTDPAPRARAVLGVALAPFVLHLALAERYGVFRDEMYYIACGEHLAFGYVDHPPLVAVMARVAHGLFGDSLRGLRLAPALLAALAVLLTAELARELGGAGFAQILAAVAVAVAPSFLATCHILSMNCVLLAAWPAAALLFVRALARDAPPAWVAFGVVCGVALLAKHSTLFFGAALAAALLVTPQRRALLSRGPWIGAGVAALIILPNLVWEQTHGWATLEFMRNAQAYKMVRMSVLAFLRAEIKDMFVLSLPLWAGGLAWLLFERQARPFQILGVAFVVLFAILSLGGGKPYYLAGAFPMLYAAGGVAVERVLVQRAARALVVALLAAGGAAIAPMVLPILDPPAFIRYAAALGVRPSSDEKRELGPLPPYFADQFGWEAMAAKIAKAYASLSPEEQRVAAIFGSNYAEAGAVDFFGHRWGLPRAVSPHNNYYLWGPPEPPRGAVLIAVASGKDLERVYEDVRKVDQLDEPYAMPFENKKAVYVCRLPKRALGDVWAALKLYISATREASERDERHPDGPDGREYQPERAGEDGAPPFFAPRIEEQPRRRDDVRPRRCPAPGCAACACGEELPRLRSRLHPWRPCSRCCRRYTGLDVRRLGRRPSSPWSSPDESWSTWVTSAAGYRLTSLARATQKPDEARIEHLGEHGLRRRPLPRRELLRGGERPRGGGRRRVPGAAAPRRRSERVRPDGGLPRDRLPGRVLAADVLDRPGELYFLAPRARLPGVPSGHPCGRQAQKGHRFGARLPKDL
jgi:hypothetical protein